jgi:hypothetical protein
MATPSEFTELEVILSQEDILFTVIGKIFADKNFRDNNIGGTKMPFYIP